MILVVDDFRDSAEALCKLLQHIGYPCAIALGGNEALAAIRAHAPEQPLLVVLDLMMPQIDGIEILRQIRADAKIAQTPVVFHTAGFNIQRREEAITLGALAWLFKGGPGGADIQMILKEIGRLYESVGGAKTITKQSSRASKSTSRNPTDPD